MTVLSGEVFDVAVDLRVDSPSFRKWFGMTLSGENHLQLFVPPGFAHGFIVTRGDATFLYKATEFYRPQYEHTIRWDDPEIGIEWPAGTRQMSDKDRGAPLLRDFPADQLPQMGK